MKKIGSLVLGLALLSAAPAFAGSQVLYTAPALHQYPAPQTLYCDLVNVGKKNADVTFEILDYFGTVTSGPMTITLAPQEGNALGENGSASGARCRFTVFGVSKKDVRGVAVYDNGSA